MVCIERGACWPFVTVVFFVFQVGLKGNEILEKLESKLEMIIEEGTLAINL